MLDLLAQSDPMALPLWAVLAISAAMYPLGFMLGSPCSDCCPPPCNANRCHFHECCGGYQCRPLPEYDAIEIEIVIDGLSYSTVDYETNWYQIGTNSVSLQLEIHGTQYDITSVTYFVLADVDQVAIKCDSISGNECQYTLKFRAVFNFFSNTQFYVETEPVDWFLSGECAPKDQTISLGPFLWEPTHPELAGYLNDVIGSAFISYAACKCGACCTAAYNEQAICSDNIAEHLCNDDEQSWKGDGTTCESVSCNSGACCKYDNTCVQVFSADYCGGTYLDGVDCDPDPCA